MTYTCWRFLESVVEAGSATLSDHYLFCRRLDDSRYSLYSSL